MRKLIVLLVVIAAFGAGYYVFWNKQASNFKAMAAQWVDAMNEQEKPFTKDLALIHYDSLEVTGFPFAMVLEANKPVFNIPVQAIIEKMPPSPPGHTIPNPPPFEWIEQVSFGDKLTLTGNILGDHYTATLSGDRTNKSLVNRAARHVFTSSTTPFTCHLGLERPVGGTPWTMQPFPKDFDTFRQVFRTADCDVRDVVWKDATSGATIMNADGQSFSASNEASDGINRKISFQAETKKLKMQPAFDSIYSDYVLMFYTLLGQQNQVEGIKSYMSEGGEQNMNIDIRYDGPTSTSAFADPGAHFHFDINHFDFTSALSRFLLEMHVADVPQGTDRSLSFVMHDKLDVTARGDQLVEANLVQMLKNMVSHPDTGANDPVQSGLQKLAATMAPEDIVNKLFPQFHTLGKISLDIDLNVKGPNEDAKFLRQGVVTVDSLDFVTDPYGLKMKGFVNRGAMDLTAPKSGKSNIDFSLTCLACDTLVSDLGNYVMRFEGVMNQTATPPRPQQITAGLITGFTQFLHGIAENASAKDLVIHLVSKDTGITISGKQIPEVIGLYMSSVAPYLPKPAPAQTAPGQQGGMPGLGAPGQ